MKHPDKRPDTIKAYRFSLFCGTPCLENLHYLSEDVLPGYPTIRMLVVVSDEEHLGIRSGVMDGPD